MIVKYFPLFILFPLVFYAAIKFFFMTFTSPLLICYNLNIK